MVISIASLPRKQRVRRRWYWLTSLKLCTCMYAHARFFLCVHMDVCARGSRCVDVHGSGSVWEEGGRERRWILWSVRENENSIFKEDHSSLSKQHFHQLLQMFADILNISTWTTVHFHTDGLNCAFVYNLQFYFITEEVMLAEENKNSGRSPLDGKFTHNRNRISYTCTSKSQHVIHFIISVFSI